MKNLQDIRVMRDKVSGAYVSIEYRRGLNAVYKCNWFDMTCEADLVAVCDRKEDAERCAKYTLRQARGDFLHNLSNKNIEQRKKKGGE